MLATWNRVKVHRDAHVQFEKSLYSVPFRLIGQSLWLKATARRTVDTTVQLYREQDLVASHPRAARAGSRATVHDHLPPEALAWNLADTQACLRAAERVGAQCEALIRALFADRVLENLRAAQGVLRLGKTYGAARLEAACARALAFGNVRYRTVKTILARGLDQQQSAPAAFDALTDTYTRGGRFYRHPDTRTH